MVDDFSKIWEFVIGLPLWALVIISLLSFLYFYKELLKKGVTLKLLWEEYAAKCCQAGKLHLMYAQFCKPRLCGHQPADHAHTA